VQVFIESFQGKPAAPTTSPGTPSGTPPMRIRVSKLVIRNATLQVCQIDAPQKDVPVKLIEMQNVCGLDGAGMTAAELSGMIVSELVRRGAAQGDINMAELFRPDVSRAMEAMLITGGCVLAPMSGQALTQPFESVLRLANPKRK
jgi:hypothetical protein